MDLFQSAAFGFILDRFFYLTGVIFWTLILIIVAASLLVYIAVTLWNAGCAIVFIRRRFKQWERGGFNHYYPLWFAALRAFIRYTFIPTSRGDYMENPTDGSRVYWPFKEKE